MFNADKIKQHVIVNADDTDSVNLEIDVSDKSYTVAGVKVLGVGMYVSTVKEDEEDDFWGDGDLYVTWDMQGLQNNEDARTAGMLLLRDLRSNDDVTKVMGEFYWESAFNDTLHSILQEAGFSEEAANSVNTSEWGMQDEGRASYDAYEIADEVRKALA